MRKKGDLYDVIIAGAGLAGLTCALHLNKRGWKVLVIEKDEFPKHKVCGEYVSNEVREYLIYLGFKPKLYNCDEVHSFKIYSQNGQSLSHKLQMGGFGLSRYKMDEKLYEIALKRGVEFIHDQVVNIEKNTKTKVSTLSGNEFITKTCITATGKRSKLDKALNREFMNKRTSWMGVKAHYKGEWNAGEVALFQFDGGYCGVSNVEGNKINVCYLVDTEAYKRIGDFDQFEKKVMFKNPSFRDAMSNMQRIMDRKIISQIYFGNKEKASISTGFIGDSAGMIYPLAGNGMAMAIHSAKIYSELVHVYLKGEISDNELIKAYSQAWNVNFNSRIRKSRYVQFLMGNKFLSKLAMNILPYNPKILSRIVEGTHGDKVSALKELELHAEITQNC